MRIRTVKPEYWTHRMHAGISEGAALLALALLNYADDEGRFEADVAFMGSQLFPRRALSVGLEAGLVELERAGYLRLYEAEVDGAVMRLGMILNFRRHQVINKARRSGLPGPGDVHHGDAENAEKRMGKDRCGSDPGTLREEYGFGGGSGAGGLLRSMERKGKERKEGSTPHTPQGGEGGEVPPLEDLGQGNGIKTGGGGAEIYHTPVRVNDEPLRGTGTEKTEGGGNLARMELRYPGTAEEVVDYGAKLNPPVGEDRCRAFFAHYAGTAQVDPNGRLVWVTSGGGVVTNWRAKLPGFRGSEFGNSPQRRGERGEEGEEAGAEPGWVVVKRLQEAIEGNVANAQGTSYRPGVRDADPERWAEALERLRRDKAEIRRLRAKG